jgi:hypothetical protein
LDVRKLYIWVEKTLHLGRKINHFTKPQEKSASWLLDMAIGYSAYHHPKGTLSVIPYMELHRNTLIDKPQSVWIGGVATEWRMNSLDTKNGLPFWYNLSNLWRIKSSKMLLFKVTFI